MGEINPVNSTSEKINHLCNAEVELPVSTSFLQKVKWALADFFTGRLFSSSQSYARLPKVQEHTVDDKSVKTSRVFTKFKQEVHGVVEARVAEGASANQAKRAKTELEAKHLTKKGVLKALGRVLPLKDKIESTKGRVSIEPALFQGANKTELDGELRETWKKEVLLHFFASPSTEDVNLGEYRALLVEVLGSDSTRVNLEVVNFLNDITDNKIDKNKLQSLYSILLDQNAELETGKTVPLANAIRKSITPEGLVQKLGDNTHFEAEFFEDVFSNHLETGQGARAVLSFLSEGVLDRENLVEYFAGDQGEKLKLATIKESKDPEKAKKVLENLEKLVRQGSHKNTLKNLKVAKGFTDLFNGLKAEPSKTESPKGAPRTNSPRTVADDYNGLW